jgi:hypothetical protein
LSIVALVIVGGVDCIRVGGVSTCTLGIGMFSCTLGGGMVSCTLGSGVSMRTLGVGCIFDVGFVVGSKVTRRIVVVCFGVDCGGVGILFINSSNFCNASYSIAPFVFRQSLSASVKSFNAFTIVSSGVSVGAVMCLCLKCTVSEILTLLVCLTYISWHL